MVVSVVVVVVSCVQFPVAFAEKDVGLPPVENLPPVGGCILVQQQELEELGIAKKVPEVTVKHAPPVFGDKQIPDHQQSSEEGGKDKIFDPYYLLQVCCDCTPHQDVDDDHQRREKYEDALSNTHKSSWMETRISILKFPSTKNCQSLPIITSVGVGLSSKSPTIMASRRDRCKPVK